MRAPARAAPASAVRPAQPPQPQRRPGDLAAGSGARRMRPDEMPEEKTDPRLGTAVPTRVRVRR
jgi:hypothetical protein